MHELLQLILDISVPLFAISSMLSVGFGFTWQEITRPLRDWRLVSRVLIANFILVPLLAYTVVQLLSLGRSIEIGLVLLTTSAGAPFLIKLTEAAEGNIVLSAGVLKLLLVVTVIHMPLVVPLILPEATIDTSFIALSLSLNMLLPLVIGLMVHAAVDKVAARLQPVMKSLSTVALVTLFLSTLFLNLPAIFDVFGTGAVLAALLVIGGAFGIGYLLGGPDKERRGVVGLATAQRNIAAATIVATQSFTDPNILVMVVLSSIVSMLFLFPIAWSLRKRSRERALSTQPSHA